MFSASLGGGAYLNGEKNTAKKVDLKHTVVSFGDFSHKRQEDLEQEYKVMGYLADKVARIRMFGAASIDYAYVAAGRTHGVIIYTKNKWDIAPGILLCREAGAVTYSLHTKDGEYNFDSPSVITTATRELFDCIKQAIL
jgi:myo-inositol-1(or 4)-monophosphatase